ncbi:unnamed protein product [Urochloa humidicola]
MPRVNLVNFYYSVLCKELRIGVTHSNQDEVVTCMLERLGRLLATEGQQDREQSALLYQNCTTMRSFGFHCSLQITYSQSTLTWIPFLGVVRLHT